MKREDLEQIAARNLCAILAHLEPAVDEGDEVWPAGIARLIALRQHHGGDALSKRMSLSLQELQSLFVLVKGLKQTNKMEGLEDHQKRTQTVVLLELLTWFDTVAQRIEELTLPVPTERIDSMLGAQRHVRAMELMLRELISESYHDQETLEQALRSFFLPEKIDEWAKTAEPDNLLSGSMFSELASLIVSKKQWGRYASMFEVEDRLYLKKNTRLTLHHMLEQIRRYRNAVAHNRRLTAIEIELLTLYYEAIAQPVQVGFEEGTTKVNPKQYAEASESDVAQFVRSMQDDLQDIRDDLEEVQEAVQDIRRDVDEQITTVSSVTKLLYWTLCVLLVVPSLMGCFASAVNGAVQIGVNTMFGATSATEVLSRGAVVAARVVVLMISIGGLLYILRRANLMQKGSLIPRAFALVVLWNVITSTGLSCAENGVDLSSSFNTSLEEQFGVGLEVFPSERLPSERITDAIENGWITFYMYPCDEGGQLWQATCSTQRENEGYALVYVVDGDSNFLLQHADLDGVLTRITYNCASGACDWPRQSANGVGTTKKIVLPNGTQTYGRESNVLHLQHIVESSVSPQDMVVRMHFSDGKQASLRPLNLGTSAARTRLVHQKGLSALSLIDTFRTPGRVILGSERLVSSLDTLIVGEGEVLELTRQCQAGDFKACASASKKMTQGLRDDDRIGPYPSLQVTMGEHLSLGTTTDSVQYANPNCLVGMWGNERGQLLVTASEITVSMSTQDNNTLPYRVTHSHGNVLRLEINQTWEVFAQCGENTLHTISSGEELDTFFPL